MRKLMILATILATVLATAAPAIAQSGEGAQSNQYRGEMAPVYCGEIDQQTAQQRLDKDPETWALLDADGDGIACNEKHVPELACEDFATQEEAQKFLDDHPTDPYNIDSDGNGIACDSNKGSTSQNGEVVLAFEVVTEGQCSADTTFFATMAGPQSEGFSRQLIDPDGDGVYTFSQSFDRGQKLINIEMIQGIGIEEGLFGPLPQSQNKVVESFGTTTFNEDVTLSSTASCHSKNPEIKKPEGEEVTLNYELAVEGQCPASTNFFAGMSTSHGYSVPLTDSDSDGVYSGSIAFGKGVDLLDIVLYRGTGIQDGPYGQIPEGEPETIQNFGNLTVEEDQTFSAITSCKGDKPAVTVNPKPKSTETGATAIASSAYRSASSSDSDAEKQTTTDRIETRKSVRTVLDALPDTGGVSLVFLSGVLLIAGSLVIRRILR